MVEAHGLIRVLKNEVTKSDEGLEMWKGKKEKVIKADPSVSESRLGKA